MPEKKRFGVIVSDRGAEVHENDIPTVGRNTGHLSRRRHD